MSTASVSLRPGTVLADLLPASRVRANRTATSGALFCNAAAAASTASRSTAARACASALLPSSERQMN